MYVWKCKKYCKCAKRAELELYVNNETPDIIGIKESWTKPKIADSELALDGYRLFRKDRENQKSEGYGAGGVLLYVKSSFNAVERWDMCNETFKESIWCEIQLKKAKMLVGVCYMVPDATEESDHGMYKLLERANKETALIMGDFNYHVDWENSEGDKEPDRIFLDFIETNFMQQHVMEPTRGKNILDLVITSDESMIENVSVGEHFNTSDHQVVRWGLVMEQTQEVKAYVKRPNFFKADYDLVRNRLKEKNLESAVMGLEVNDAWKKFNGIMREIIEKNIPNHKRTNKRRPWVTCEVQKKRRAKNKAWKKFHKLKEEIRNAPGCENEAMLENLNRNIMCIKETSAMMPTGQQ